MRPSTTISARAGTATAARHSVNARSLFRTAECRAGACGGTRHWKFQLPCTRSMRPPLSIWHADHSTRSAYMFENTVELFEGVVADHELALARGRMLHGDLGTELVAQLGFELADVRIDARRALAGRRL